MTCKTPCDNCSCKNNSPYESDYQEIDSSPMGTLQAKFLEEYNSAPRSPVSFFDKECAENPHAKGCIIYD